MRKLTEPGAKWLNNMLLGFGVKEISYFTYYTRTENKTDGESFPDNGSFVNLYGKPTNIYYRKLTENIIKSPELWLWTHKRWKRTREGYAKREAKRIEDRRRLVENARKDV